MKLKEKLAQKYASYRSTTGNEKLDKAIAELSAWSFEAGFEEAKRLALKLSKDYAHVSVCNKNELADCFAACELVHDLKKLGESDV